MLNQLNIGNANSCTDSLSNNIDLSSFYAGGLISDTTILLYPGLRQIMDSSCIWTVGGNWVTYSSSTFCFDINFAH